jgi:hypothetical protein
MGSESAADQQRALGDACSATPDLTEPKVATASTSVPPAVASAEIVAQSANVEPDSTRAIGYAAVAVNVSL